MNCKNGATAHNKRLTLRRLFGGSGLRSARSVGLHPRSHASLQPQFASPGLCSAKPLFGLPNRRQPRTLYDILQIFEKNNRKLKFLKSVTKR